MSTISDNEEDDLEYARKMYKDMLGKSSSAVDLMMDLLRDTESARVGEVTANLIKSTADIADKLIDLHKSNKELKAPSKEDQNPALTGPSTVNNSVVYIGSTSELQKLLKNNENEERVIN